MKMGPSIAEVGGLLGDPVRAAMLAGLIDGRALPAGELALIGNVAPQTASFHLSKLLHASLLSVERQGRHKYYRISSESVASTLESLAALSQVREQVQAHTDSRYQSDCKKELRFARSCYKHLAGRLAVEIHRAMLDKGILLMLPDKVCSLTEAGQHWCQSLGLLPTAVSSGRDPIGRACLDWTERHHHLGGPLGAALFSQLKDKRWVAPTPNSRSLRLTQSGRRGLQSSLGLVVVL